VIHVRRLCSEYQTTLD